MLDKLCGVSQDTDLLAVARDMLFVVLPADELSTVVAEAFGSGNKEVSRLQLQHHTGKHTELEVASVDGFHDDIAPVEAGHRFPPALRDPRQIQLAFYSAAHLAHHRKPLCPCHPLLQ